MTLSSGETADIVEKPRKLLPIGLAACLPLMVILKMGFIFLLIGMMPTWLGMMMVRHPKKYVFSTVAAFNLAGVFPDLLGLAVQGGAPSVVWDKLYSPAVWGSMYGAGLLGWAIVWLSPSVAMVILSGVYRGRILHMEHVQKRMEEEWGPEVTGERPE